MTKSAAHPPEPLLYPQWRGASRLRTRSARCRCCAPRRGRVAGDRPLARGAPGLVPNLLPRRARAAAPWAVARASDLGARAILRAARRRRRRRIGRGGGARRADALALRRGRGSTRRCSAARRARAPAGRAARRRRADAALRARGIASNRARGAHRRGLARFRRLVRLLAARRRRSAAAAAAAAAPPRPPRGSRAGSRCGRARALWRAASSKASLLAAARAREHVPVLARAARATTSTTPRVRGGVGSRALADAPPSARARRRLVRAQHRATRRRPDRARRRPAARGMTPTPRSRRRSAARRRAEPGAGEGRRAGRHAHGAGSAWPDCVGVVARAP